MDGFFCETCGYNQIIQGDNLNREKNQDYLHTNHNEQYLFTANFSVLTTEIDQFEKNMLCKWRKHDFKIICLTPSMHWSLHGDTLHGQNIFV